MSNLDLALSVALGIGLAAATGFRLFLPLLILSGAAYTGHASLNEGFAWLGTPAAVIMLGTAAIVEIAAFYIPGVDNLLDTVATPGAVVAGTIVSAAVMTDLPPMVKWTAAIIAGGGVAGITQGLTAMLRAKSTVFTGGLGNSAVATAELGSASLISILALAAPLAALALVILFFWLAFRLLRGLARRSDQPNDTIIGSQLHRNRAGPRLSAARAARSLPTGPAANGGVLSGQRICLGLNPRRRCAD